MRFLVTAGIYRDNGALLSTIETVVEENPLSLATSRMVTIEFLTLEERISHNPENSLCKTVARKSRKSLSRPRLPCVLHLIQTRTLADTTAESATSVKHTSKIRILNLAFVMRHHGCRTAECLAPSCNKSAKWQLQRAFHPNPCYRSSPGFSTSARRP